MPEEGLEPASSYERRILSPFPSQKGLTGLTPKSYYNQFMQSRKTGVATITLKDLGSWESLEMVQRYTCSLNFQDSLKFYKASLS
jgi:hypothetical protein